MVKRTHLLLACSSVLLASCSSSPLTELVIVVDTDLDVPAELDSVRIEVPGAQQERVTVSFGAGAPRPATLTLVNDRTALGPVNILVTGFAAGGEVIERGATDVFFVRGERRMLRLDLLRSCRGVECGPEQTCEDGACRAASVDPGELSEWDPPTPLEGSDGGVPGDVDAALDDAGPVGCEPGDACDDGVACSEDACVDGVCTHTLDDAACDDGVECTRDICDSLLGCRNPPNDSACDDGFSCTSDRCDPVDGCGHSPEHAVCDDTIACTMERCSTDCVTDDCEEGTGCVRFAFDAMCDDTVGCTTDICEFGSGCRSAANDTACGDGFGCTTDVCDSVMDCQHTPTDALCADGVSCTSDTCDPTTGDPTTGCVITPDDTSCTPDAFPCTAEVCDPTGGCGTIAVHTACASGEHCDPAAGCTTAPTWTAVYAASLIVCLDCHVGAFAAGGLDMSTEAVAYTSLVGVTGICDGSPRVSPGDAEGSLLWRKLNGLCGDRMPSAAAGYGPLSAAAIADIAAWINAGALP